MITNDIIINLINGISLSFGYCLILYGIISLLTFNEISFVKLFIPVLILAIIINFKFVFLFIPCCFIFTFILLLIIKIPKWKSFVSCFITLLVVYTQLTLITLIDQLSGLTSSQIIELRNAIYYNVFNAIIFVIFSVADFFIIKFIYYKTNKLSNYNNANISWNIILFSINIIFLTIVISISGYILVHSESETQNYIVWFENALIILFVLFSTISVYAMNRFLKKQSEETKIQKRQRNY